MLSMTGFGRGECEREGHVVSFQISSYNRKHADYRISLDKELQFLERDIWTRLNQRIARGAVQLRGSWRPSAGGAATTINAQLAKDCYQQLATLHRELEMSEPIRLADLLTIPGVADSYDNAVSEDELKSMVGDALTIALDELFAMRGREGSALGAALAEHLATLRRLQAAIVAKAPDAGVAYRQRLLQRVQELVASASLDEPQLLKAVGVYLERTDITEELTRLDAHFDAIEALFATDGPVGRKLDFLVQEVNREINTVGSKCDDGTITQLVVDFKAELERVREQVQNVE